VLEKVQQRLDQDHNKMTLRRQTAEHPFGSIKAWMGATHFLMRRRCKVATEMALNVLAYNLKRAIAILGCTNSCKQCRLKGNLWRQGDACEASGLPNELRSNTEHLAWQLTKQFSHSLGPYRRNPALV
jgi:hypothetical protein